MAENKVQQGEEKTGQPKQGSEQGKPASTSKQQKTAGPSKVKATAQKATQKATQKAKKAVERTGNGIANAGKAARELGEGLQERIEREVTPAAERARRKVAETTKQVREGLAPAAAKAKQGLAETPKIVREEIGPAAEKAGKGLSAIFKSTARATRKSARILEIKASIATEMRTRQKLFTELGQRYYKVQKKKTPSKSDQDALDALVGDIKKVEAQIHALEVQEKTTREST